MRTVIAPLRHLHRLRVSNVFVLDGGPGDVWLVDTGHVAERLTLITGQQNFSGTETANLIIETLGR